MKTPFSIRAEKIYGGINWKDQKSEKWVGNDGDEQACKKQLNHDWFFSFLFLSLSLLVFFCVGCGVGGEFHAWKQKIKKGRKDWQHV